MSPARAATACGLATFNALPGPEARQRLLTCLSVPRWADDILAARPCRDVDALLAAAKHAAAGLTDAELESALAGHPRLGERASDPDHQPGFSRREQSGIDARDAEVMTALAQGNAAYEHRFNRVFLLRAAGRSSTEVLAELRRRLANDDAAERTETVAQLREIALLRLEELL